MDVFNYESPEYDKSSFEVLVQPGTNAFYCLSTKFFEDGILSYHIFRFFAQFGVDEIPERMVGFIQQVVLGMLRERCFESSEAEVVAVSDLAAMNPHVAVGNKFWIRITVVGLQPDQGGWFLSSDDSSWKAVIRM